MQKRMETAVKRTSDRIIPVAMPKYQRGQEIQWQWPKIRLPPIDCPLSAAFWPSAKAIFWKSFQLSGRRPIENKNPPLPPVPVLSRPNGRGRTQMKEILVFRLSMRSVMVVIIITQWTSRHRGDPFSSLRRPPLLSIQIWQSDKCKRTLPSPALYSLSRIRPTTPGILAKKKKKKLEQFSSVRLELKSPNLLITKAFQFFSSNKKIILVVLRRCNTGRPVLPPFRWIAPISEPFLSFGELF